MNTQHELELRFIITQAREDIVLDLQRTVIFAKTDVMRSDLLRLPTSAHLIADNELPVSSPHLIYSIVPSIFR